MGRDRERRPQARLDQVLEGIAAAKRAGLRVKINAVALKGFNEDELFSLIDWCGGEGHDLTFIEVMPMGDMGEELRLDQYWPLSELRARLAERFTLTETDETTGGPARYFRLEETGQRIGFITPLTHNFCESCNRVRVTCTGELFMCLGQEDNADLRAPLRAHPSADSALIAAIRGAISRKPKGHDFDYSRQGVAGQMVHRHQRQTSCRRQPARQHHARKHPANQPRSRRHRDRVDLRQTHPGCA